ncbi:MAG: RecX family transcriptional regulator [Rhodospirillales bacterium]|nr:RecX family transcriptional regulator [Rhodospirillales bacterium]
MSKRALTQRALRDRALHYLARYAASRSRVEAVLTRRLAAARAEGRAEVGPEDIPPLLDRLEALGLIDDRTYAETEARSLARRGFSSQALALQLGEQGLARPLVDAAIRELEPGLDSDLVRGWRYARRRLGPYRSPDRRPERRTRDLAALQRRGFPLEVALGIVDAEAPPQQHVSEDDGLRFD